MSDRLSHKLQSYSETETDTEKLKILKITRLRSNSR
jgi:hypothetical protein